MNESLIFLIIVIVGIITLSIRSSFIMLAGKTDRLQYLQKILRFVPVTVLPAIILPALFYNHGMLVLSTDNKRLIAGILAILVTIYKRNVLLTLSVGMVSLWILNLF